MDEQPTAEIKAGLNNTLGGGEEEEEEEGLERPPSLVRGSAAVARRECPTCELARFFRRRVRELADRLSHRKNKRRH